MIFIKNKYHTWYFNIIKKAQLRSIPENDEVHHIVPRSLGGSNNSGEKNPMFGLFGQNNPSFGSKRNTEQKNNIRISKVLKNLDKYFLVMKYLENNITSVSDLSYQCGVSEYTVRQLKKGDHIACKLYKEKNAV